MRQVSERLGWAGGPGTIPFVEVRPVRPEEFDELGRATVEAYEALPGEPLSAAYLEELADVASRAAEAEVLVALVDGRLVGGVTYVRPPGRYAEFGPGEAGIRHLAVVPAARGHGVGAALVAACLERARADGFPRICLFTTPSMATAHRLYERLGFLRRPERDWTLPDIGLHLLSYVLELEPPAPDHSG
jgi:GNAT superfamily N-acetyltransferase